MINSLVRHFPLSRPSYSCGVFYLLVFVVVLKVYDYVRYEEVEDQGYKYSEEEWVYEVLMRSLLAFIYFSLYVLLNAKGQQVHYNPQCSYL